MDILAFAFCSLLLLAGVVLTVTVYGGARRKARPGGQETESARHQYMRALRLMERRRSKIWLEMDRLHAEFERRNSAPAAEHRPVEVARLTGGVSPGEDLTPDDVRAAFEEFLRRS